MRTQATSLSPNLSTDSSPPVLSAKQNACASHPNKMTPVVEMNGGLKLFVETTCWCLDGSLTAKRMLLHNVWCGDASYFEWFWKTTRLAIQT